MTERALIDYYVSVCIERDDIEVPEDIRDEVLLTVVNDPRYIERHSSIENGELCELDLPKEDNDIALTE